MPKQTIILSTKAEVKEVEADVVNGLAIFKENNTWNLTHVQTGMCIENGIATKKRTANLRDALLALDIDYTKPWKDVSVEDMVKMKKAIYQWKWY